MGQKSRYSYQVKLKASKKCLEGKASFGTAYNNKRFYRLTQLVRLKAVIRKKPAYQRSMPEITAETILNRNFAAEKPKEKCRQRKLDKLSSADYRSRIFAAA